MERSTVHVNFRMDAELKRIPFEVAVDPFYSDQTMARLKKSIARMESTGDTIYEVGVDDEGLGRFRIPDKARRENPEANSYNSRHP